MFTFIGNEADPEQNREAIKRKTHQRVSEYARDNSTQKAAKFCVGVLLYALDYLLIFLLCLLMI